jgi:uncharacterized protein (DUF305 family)
MSTSADPGIRGRVRAALGDVVWRTLVAVAIAAAIVALAFATGVAQRAADHAARAHGAATAASAHAHAVRSEAEFVAAMIPHHEEAVASAAAILAISQREEVRSLAADVVSAQSAEIAQLRAWLAEWYPEQGDVAYEPMMRPFTGLRPAEADEVFVADMIHHHEGAIAMAEAYLALRGPKRPEVEALADDIVRVQRAEIAVLALMLQMWGVAPADHTGH